MALLQNDKAIFYHPLDDATESLKAQAWTVDSGDLAGAGKVSNALSGVVSDASSFDAEKVFNSASTLEISTTLLSSTTFIVAYTDGGNGSFGTAIFGTVSGTDITLGAESVFNSADTEEISATTLSSTTFVVAYRDADNGDFGTAIVGTVAGTDITFGAEKVFNSVFTDFISADALSPTTFVVAYRDASNKGTAVVGIVAGTDITFGAKKIFNNGSTREISTTFLSSTTFVVVFRDSGAGNTGRAVVGTVSGTDITLGAESVFNNALTTDISISTITLSSTTFVVAYRDQGNGSFGTAIFGTVSGTDITFGAEKVFNSAITDFISAIALSPTTFVVAYGDGGNGSFGTAIVGTVAGTVITFGAEKVFNSANTDFISAVALSTTFVVAYRDTGNGNFGTAIIGSLPPVGAAASLTGVGASYTSAAASTKVAFAGWMKNPSA